MQYKKFLKIFLLSVSFILCLVAGINYYFDFYAVFRQDKDIYYESINDRYAKVAYILKNKDKYDTYIWGSSRIQKADPQILSEKAYNFGASAGSPEDCLRDLKILVKNDVRIKKVYLALDNFSYKNDHEYDLLSFNRIPQSDEPWENISYLTRVLFKEPDFHKMKGYLGLTDYRLEKTYLTTTGKLEVPQYVEDNIDSDLQKYVYDSKFSLPSSADDENAHIEKTVALIKEISELCKNNNIEFEFFCNPVHIASYLNDDVENSNRFKRELVKLGDFYDFNNINFISQNNYFWYETSHPRAFVCDMILTRVAGKNMNDIPSDFGNYITKDNIDFYCQKYIEEKAKFNKDYTQFIPEDKK